MNKTIRITLVIEAEVPDYIQADAVRGEFFEEVITECTTADADTDLRITDWKLDHEDL